jgi:hypothetical protein
MGQVIDIRPYRKKAGENRRGKANPSDGVGLEAAPPATMFKYYQTHALSRGWGLLSEYLLREFLEQLS